VAGDGEGPVREVAVSPFWIDETAVTNRAYARFVRETGYVTDAERLGWSFAFDGFLPPASRRYVLDGSVPGAPWWRPVAQATWRQPYGPGTASSTLDQHPVVHVSFNDAAAFAAWAGKQLPTEAQWEYAARARIPLGRSLWRPWAARIWLTRARTAPSTPRADAPAGAAASRHSVAAHAATSLKNGVGTRDTDYLFHRPAGLADGLALKEPALPTTHRGIRPNNLGPPFRDTWSRTRHFAARLANCKDTCTSCTAFRTFARQC